MYMDSVLSEEECIQLYTELSAIWNKAGMSAKIWISNSTEVVRRILEEDQARERIH